VRGAAIIRIRIRSLSNKKHGIAGRMHPATLWAGAMVVGFKPLLFYAVAVTSPWLALADGLRI
jgi:hypothetical protein